MDHKQILLVDDDIVLLDTLKASLSLHNPNYQITTAADGYAALELLEIHDYDLIVTDYNMKSIDGLELASTIRFFQPSSQIILMTGWPSPFVQKECDRLGIYQYFPKPIDLHDLNHVAAKAVDCSNVASLDVMALAESQYRQIISQLEQLKQDINVRYMSLVDLHGGTVAAIGLSDQAFEQEVISLLGGALLAVQATGDQASDEDNSVINLVYRESNTNGICAFNIGRFFMLVLVIDRTTYSSRFGEIWHYARKRINKLENIINNPYSTDNDQTLKMISQIDVDIENLFNFPSME